MKKNILVLFILITSFFSARAQYVTIPDSNFRNYLMTIVPNAFNGSGQMDTTNAYMLNVNSMVCSTLNIYNLEGVQYFKGLSILDCSNNFIATLPDLPSIYILNCSSNSLSSLPALIGCGSLDCSNNNITSLPPLNNVGHLVCSHNQLTSLPTLDVVYNLDCSYNNITAISGLPNIVSLICNHNLNLNCIPYLPNNGILAIDSTSVTCLPNYLYAFPNMPICSSGSTCDSRALLTGKLYLDLNYNNTYESNVDSIISSAVMRDSLSHYPNQLLNCIDNNAYYFPLEIDTSYQFYVDNIFLNSKGFHTFPASYLITPTTNNVNVMDFAIQLDTINYVTIPDSNFRKYLQAILPSAFNCFGKMDTTNLSILNLNRLDCNSLNIKNLEGIQYFKKLEELNCQNNGITSLPSLPILQYLWCSNNQLTSLPNLPMLNLLDCSNNQLINLPNFPDVSWLDCAYNQLTSLPNLPKLNNLDCSHNNITTVSHLRNIYTLNCSNNLNLNCLPYLPSFCVLNVDYTNISCMPNFVSSQALPICSTGSSCDSRALLTGKVYLDNNYNNTFDSNVDLIMNVASIKDSLGHYTSQFPNVPSIDYNYKYYFPLQIGTNYQFYVDSTNFFKYGFHSFPAMYSITPTTNNVTIVDFALQIDTLNYVTIPDNNFRNSLRSKFPSAFNFYGKMDTTNVNVLNSKFLNVNSLNIVDLSGIQFFKNLDSLSCSYNQLTSLPNLSQLKFLDCSNNQISTLPSFPLVSYLDCSFNQLLSLPNLPTVANLNCFFNKITSLPNLPLVTDLNCAYNQITSLPNLPLVTNLKCYFNKITSLPNLPLVTDLICAYNQITSLPELPSVVSLNVSGNLIKILHHLPDQLKEIYCEDNPLLNCVENLPDSLTEFYFSNTSITCLPNNISSWSMPNPLPICTQSCAPYSLATGKIYYDINNNNMFDPSDSLCKFCVVNSNKGWVSSSNASGYYEIRLDSGVVNNINVPMQYYSTNPASHNILPDTSGILDSNYNFALHIVPNINDLTIDVTHGPARPGFNQWVAAFVNNVGTTNISNGTIKMIVPTGHTFNNASPIPSTIIGDTLVWNNVNLNMSANASININWQIPTNAVLGSPYNIKAWVMPITSDSTPANNSVNIIGVYQGSFDPNDKTVSQTSLDTAHATDALKYVIRFQNTGTDTAFNITVSDQLSSKLDLSTFKMLGASHSYTYLLRDKGELDVFFNNIQLPDSNINEPLSHGYFEYSIKPKSTNIIGDTITNMANIYFDYNLPVATNTAITAMVQNAPLSVDMFSFDATLQNKNDAKLHWITNKELNNRGYEIEHSFENLPFASVGYVAGQGNTFSMSTYNYSHKNLPDGQHNYRLKIIDNTGSYSYSKIARIFIGDDETTIINIYPNPSQGEFNIYSNKTLSKIEIYNNMGQAVYSQASSDKTASINIGHLANGVYTLKVGATVKKIVLNK